MDSLVELFVAVDDFWIIFRPRRMGTFTPINMVSEARRQRERSDQMVSEEVEQHLANAPRADSGAHSAQDRGGGGGERLEQAADALLRAGQMQLTGQLRVAGVPDVAGVMGDVVGLDTRCPADLL